MVRHCHIEFVLVAVAAHDRDVEAIDAGDDTDLALFHLECGG